MVIVKLQGGLGNQMFEYAAGLCLAQRHGEELLLDTSPFLNQTCRSYMLDRFNITGTLASPNIIKKARYSQNKAIDIFSKLMFWKKLPTYIEEKSFYYDNKHPFYPNNIYLDGYWQSEKYFLNISEIIRDEFTLKEKPNKINSQHIHAISDCNSVAVHIRRGDYVNNQATNSYHGSCSLQYYELAIDTMLREITDAHFFIFSDDPDWTSKNLINDAPTTYISNNAPDDGHEDLRLMSYCDHQIIANSSFSWWGAWLNSNPNKIVIAPKKWFNASDIDTRDLLPSNWLKL